MLELPYMQERSGPDSKVKVVYLITKGVWGGAGKYVYNLATSLPKDKYNVSVICGKGNILREKLEEKGVKVFSIGSMKRDISIFGELISFIRLFWRIYKEKPDVLHLNSPKAGGMGGVIGRILFVKKIIYTAHGWTFNENRPAFQNSLILIFSWITTLLSHKVIVIAKREEEQALSFPLVKKEKIILIGNGVDKIDFKERNTARKEITEKVGLEQDENIWMGTLAELHKNKGFEYALEAVSKINTKFKYYIIGEGEERKKIEFLIKKYNLEEKVYLVGFMEKACEYLKAFDIFMLTSIKEGLPYTLLEAGLAENAVIASSVGGIPDIIENGKTGILTTKTRSGEITRAIEYLIDKPDERKLFANNLKQKVEKEFSLEQMLEKTLMLYN